MKYQFLDSERVGEVELKDAVWMCFEGTNDKVNYWGVGKGNQWMGKVAFNAWWNAIVLQSYSHPLSTNGLHLLSGKNTDAVQDDNIGVVHKDYAGDLVDMSNWEPVLGWCQVGVLGGAMYSRKILGDPKREKQTKAAVPWPRLRALLATIAGTFYEGYTNYIMVADLRNYIAHRFEDWDKEVDEKRVCKVNALQDYTDFWNIAAPIEEKARENALAGKSNGKSRKTTPLLILTNKDDKPVNMIDMPFKRYKIYDDYRLKKGFHPQLWDGSRTAVELFEALAKENLRIGV